MGTEGGGHGGEVRWVGGSWSGTGHGGHAWREVGWAGGIGQGGQQRG